MGIGDKVLALLGVSGFVGTSGAYDVVAPPRREKMKKLVLAALLLTLTSAMWAQPPKPKPMKLKVGDMAPDFTLLSFDGKDIKAVSLHDYRGKKSVALAFYVFAFTGG
jgi:hypothetical protein